MAVVDLRSLSSVVASFPLPVVAHLPAFPANEVACPSLAAELEQLELKSVPRGRVKHIVAALEQYNPRRVFVAKRIARLGLNSGKVLREHFGRYGPVTEVMLVNAMAPRRDAGMAYVLMERAADVDEILHDGGETGQLLVGDREVAISRFWSRAGFATQGGDTCPIVSNPMLACDIVGFVSL